jgi:hypothetical protein
VKVPAWRVRLRKSLGSIGPGAVVGLITALINLIKTWLDHHQK